jgi:alpha-L-arabinofuranosidase
MKHISNLKFQPSPDFSRMGNALTRMQISACIPFFKPFPSGNDQMPGYSVPIRLMKAIVKIGLVAVLLFLANQSLLHGDDMKAGDEYKGVVLPSEKEAPEGESKASVTVRDTVEKPLSPQLLGYNHYWTWMEKSILDGTNGEPALSAKYLATMKGYPFHLVRMSGTCGQHFEWKKSIGPIATRPPHNFDEQNPKDIKTARFGVVEWINSVHAIDPSAQFVWTFNMWRESPEDNADLVQFLRGDKTSTPRNGVNWAEKRIAYGIAEPVDVAIWELGNEMDWGAQKYDIKRYVSECKKVIAAVRAVDPKMKIAAQTQTSPWNPMWKKKGIDWRDWHRTILKELGDQIDYISFHPYYYGMPPSILETYINAIADDIHQITGSDRIKIFNSEHAKWPDLPGKGGIGTPEWRNSWYLTHALVGCIDTATWMNRMICNKEVTAQAYHCVSSGPWGIFKRDAKTGDLYQTGIAEMFKMLSAAFGDALFSTEITGDFTDVTKSNLTLTVSAMRTPKGMNFFIVNRAPKLTRPITFTLPGKYRLVKTATLTAESLHSVNTLTDHPIQVKETACDVPLTSYTVPPKSIVALYAVRTE